MKENENIDITELLQDVKAQLSVSNVLILNIKKELELERKLRIDAENSNNINSLLKMSDICSTLKISTEELRKNKDVYKQVTKRKRKRATI